MSKKSFLDGLEKKWQAEKKKRISARKRQNKLKEELREENKNLSMEKRKKKLYVFSFIVVCYVIFRMVFRYFLKKTVFSATDILFGIITILIYALYIFKWSKEIKK